MTMRCVDVIEGLADPHGPDSAALTEHLTHCPRCAAWARRSARLDRLWEATRPEEPAPEAWATVWAQVSQALDTAPPLAPSPRLRPSAAPGPRPWRRWGVATFAVAQAAVLLVAAWIVTRPGPDPSHGPKAQAGLALKPATQALKGITQAQARPPIEIEDGEIALIGSSPKGAIKVSRASVADEGSSAVGADFVYLGALEAMAEWAMAE
jgi:hypothetical protein